MDVAKQRRASADSLAPDLAESDPTYRAVLDWIWSFSARVRSPDELLSQRATKLDRMHVLLASLGDPQARFPSVLVAGSKGKGSTVAMLAACLQAAGHRTGRYTSPHLVNWRERTVIDNEPIPTDAVVDLAESIRAAVEALPDFLGAPTTFEVGTAFAFLHFARSGVDMGVIEVGVGGRLDATNVLEPLVSVITPISYEHTATLGSTLTAIAEHKAGILRAGRPGIIAPQPEEARATIERIGREVGAHLEFVSRDAWWPGEIGLLGDHQRDNATTAVAALRALGGVPESALREGLKSVEWPGRLQVLQSAPGLILDGAHNAASADVLRRALEQYFPSRRVSLVLGITVGKDARGMLETLGPRAQRVRLTRSHHERSADPHDLAALARALVPAAAITVEPSVEAAVQAAMSEADERDLVVVTGSLFVVGEALVWWRRSHR